jgi:hypothetical protein
VPQDLLRVFDEVAFPGEFRREVRHGTPDVGGNQGEQVADRRREAPHVQLRVEEHHRNVGAAQQVVECAFRPLAAKLGIQGQHMSHIEGLPE